MPRLRHVEDEPATIERLERERRVRRDARQEAGVLLLGAVGPQQAGGSRLAHRDLPENPQPLAADRLEARSVV
ncbi:MAG: hypothetical protein ACREE7_18240, partial [Dongiaceae bacterium]